MASPAIAKSADEQRAKHGQNDKFFQIAEAMEGGNTRGDVSAPSKPPQVTSPQEDRQLTVVTCKEQNWTKLVNAAGETLLIAKLAEEGNRFSIHVALTAPKPFALFNCGFALTAAGRDKREW